MHTGYGMVSPILRTDPAVAVTVETRHGLLAEEGEGLFENWNKRERVSNLAQFANDDL